MILSGQVSSPAVGGGVPETVTLTIKPTNSTTKKLTGAYVDKNYNTRIFSSTTEDHIIEPIKNSAVSIRLENGGSSDNIILGAEYNLSLKQEDLECIVGFTSNGNIGAYID